LTLDAKSHARIPVAMQIGIVGLPNVGKSTLFNALLKKQQALAANYPFATVEPNVGVVDVPDQRLDKLTEMVNPEKTVPAVVKFVDIAGLVKGAAEGEGLGNQFLAHVREADALVHVIRAFEDENITRAGSVDPESDRQVIETELLLADIQSLQNKLDKEFKKPDKEAVEVARVCNKILPELSRGVLAADVALSEEEKNLAKKLNLLTSKPVIYIYNVSEDAFTSGNFGEVSNEVVHLCAKLEFELALLSPEEAEEYKQELGIHASGLDRVIKRGYETLGLQTYFTAGPKEVRAWTVEKGATAPEAAGKIHTDFQRGFIAAEVISYNDFVAHGGRLGTKEKGRLRAEGKSYVVQDGDVIEFRFNV